MKLSFLACVFTALLVLWSGGRSASADRIYWEAEAATSIRPPLQKILAAPDKQFSGKGYLGMPSSRRHGEGKATYQVKVQKAGVYFLWARVMWRTKAHRSISVSVNGGPVMQKGYSNLYGRWHWAGDNRPLELRAGLNTITLQQVGQGVKIDRFFFTQEKVT